VQAVEQPRKLAPVVDLMAALKESLAQTKKPAGSEKGTERQPAEQPKHAAAAADKPPGFKVFRVSRFQSKNLAFRPSTLKPLDP